jgi:hypothetical protein
MGNRVVAAYSQTLNRCLCRDVEGQIGKHSGFTGNTKKSPPNGGLKSLTAWWN